MATNLREKNVQISLMETGSSVMDMAEDKLLPCESCRALLDNNHICIVMIIEIIESICYVKVVEEDL